MTIPLPPDWFNSNFLGFSVCVVFVVEDVIHRSPGNIFCELKSLIVFIPVRLVTSVIPLIGVMKIDLLIQITCGWHINLVLELR